MPEKIEQIKELQLNVVDIFNEVYKRLEPAIWLVNLLDGSTLTSKNFTSFLDLSKETRMNISAFRIQFEQNTFTISRKLNKNLLPGFFYHIKEGRKTILGSLGIHISFFAERIGFCYNKKGDALAIRIDHSNFLHKVNALKNSLIPLVQGNKIQPEKLNKILSKDISYKINLEIYHENLIKNKVNIRLFGNLDHLPEIPEMLPKISDNLGEVNIKGSKN